jgi:hypothetical protein
MNTAARPPQSRQEQEPSRDSRARQRFGHVTGHQPTEGGDVGGYLVRDNDTGITYACDSADIVTEGLRTLRAGERIRFLADPVTPGRATYVIRLDLPDVEEYYT